MARMMTSNHRIVKKIGLDESESRLWRLLEPDEARDAIGGDKGTRTPDLVSAIDALSQLSYIPLWRQGDSNP